MNPSTVSNTSSPSNSKNHIFSACKDTKMKTSKNKRCCGGGAVKLSTHPQGVAARHRRRRISDGFKVLRSLVPGGSKMDTVSMLEEAVQYVKFLKAQIRLHHAAIGFADHNYYSYSNNYDNNNNSRGHHLVHESIPFDHNQLQVVDYHHVQCCHESNTATTEGFQTSWFDGGGNIGPF